jgi:hypothetical protein
MANATEKTNHIRRDPNLITEPPKMKNQNNVSPTVLIQMPLGALAPRNGLVERVTPAWVA